MALAVEPAEGKIARFDSIEQPGRRFMPSRRLSIGGS
jgi:hypothetical protein